MDNELFTAEIMLFANFERNFVKISSWQAKVAKQYLARVLIIEFVV